jgi:hypothetical protein
MDPDIHKKHPNKINVKIPILQNVDHFGSTEPNPLPVQKVPDWELLLKKNIFQATSMERV